MARPPTYSQDYIRKCFDAWYLAGRPNTPHAIKKIIPEHESGRRPGTFTINKWIIQGAWDTWADELDAKVNARADVTLINRKAKLLRDHQEQAAKVTKKALEYLLDEDKGFDSSSSAVQAFFRGLEEQRKTEGFSDLLEKLDKMTNNEMEREIITLLNRAADNDQIIDAGDVPNLLPDGEDESQE